MYKRMAAGEDVLQVLPEIRMGQPSHLPHPHSLPAYQAHLTQIDELCHRTAHGSFPISSAQFKFSRDEAISFEEENESFNVNREHPVF